MAAPNGGSDAFISTTQLVQYDDDDDNDEKMKSPHSNHLEIIRDAELGGEKDGLDEAEVHMEENRVPEAGTDYQEAVDGNGGGDLYVERSQGQSLSADALGVFCTYETADDVFPEDGVGTGHDFSENLQERVVEETVLDEESSRVNAENRDVYLSDDPMRCEGTEHSSFSSTQQLQLRAQILVYGDLIKGILPEESLMSSAFSDEGGGPDQSPIGWNWERTWQIAAEKEAERRESEVQEEELQEDEGQAEKGDAIMIEENVVTSGPNTPGSPVRKEFTVTMPQGPVEIVDSLVSNIDGQSNDPGMLSANLDAVVQTIVAATPSVVDGSGLRDADEFQSERSPSLDPWLKPQLIAHGNPAPGSVLAANSSFTEAAPSNQVEPENTPSNIPAVASTPEKQPSKRKGRSSDRKTPTKAEEVVPVQDAKDDRKTRGSKNAISTGGQQRKRRGRKAQSPKAVDTPAARGKTRGRKPQAGKDAAESTPPLELPISKKTPEVQSAPRRGQRAKTVTDTQATLDPATRTMPGTSSQPEAIFPDRRLSSDSLQLGKGKEKEDGSDLHAQTQTWLEQAKVSFNEAFAAANSAAEQKEFVESVTAQTNQTLGKDSNQNASVAAAVYAAASVAKAAAEAAKVAYHAALQATCIVADGCGDSGGKIGVGSSDKDGGPGGRRSAIAAAKEEARKRPVVMSPSKTTPQSADAVLRAARLMAEAASEAGAVLAKGNAVAPLTSSESPVMHDGSRRGGGRGRPGKELLSFTSPVTKGNGSTAKLGGDAVRGSNTDIRESLKKGARRVAKAGQDLDASKLPAAPGGETITPPLEKLTRRNLVQFVSSPSHAADVPEVFNQDQIVEGSLVEVMPDEEGLRGGWFSAKVLQLKSRDVHVLYDELLTDDGSAHLKEWYPLDGPSVGTEGGQPRIRLISSKNVPREGRKKRRRNSAEQLIWAVGDRVDAYDKDGWWEGIIKAIDENDETKITIHFPAEQDTSVLKSWNLRPSLFWKDGRWEQWTRDGDHESKLEDGQSKKHKANQSPKVQARKSGRKTTPGKALGEVKEKSRSSRRLKELGENAVASPTIATRSSPRQNIQKKDGRSRVTREATEV